MKNNLKDIDIDKLINYNWQYNLDYDYDRSGCNGECYDICRCTTIENIRVNSVDIDAIAREICGNKENRILNYCVNRILNHNIGDHNYWHLSVCRGYYGEEIDRAYFNGNFPVEKLATLLSYKDNNAEMIKLILADEYTYVLPELEKITDFTVAKIPLKNISIGQDSYYRKLDKAIVNRYKNFDLPVGICLQVNNEKVRLIDGYHRVAAAKEANKKIVEVIIANGG